MVPIGDATLSGEARLARWLLMITRF